MTVIPRLLFAVLFFGLMGVGVGCKEVKFLPEYQKKEPPIRRFVVGRPGVGGPGSLIEAKDRLDACLKTGWKYREPCVVMELTDDLANRTSVIAALDKLQSGLVLDRVGAYTVIGPPDSGGKGQVKLVKSSFSEQSLKTCLEAGWGASECRYIQLTVVGLAAKKMEILTKATERGRSKG